MKRVALAFLVPILIALASASVYEQSGSLQGLPESGRITGRIVDGSTGQPLPAEVGISGNNEGMLSLKHAKSSTPGQFEVRDLPDGKYHLVTKLDGYASEHQTVSLSPGRFVRLSFA